MNRKIGLDILRAVAILVVVEQHGRSIIYSAFPQISKLGATDGVDLFFVLSGFLITNIFFKVISESDAKLEGLESFLKRRWIRTLPLFFIVLFFNILFFYKDTTALKTLRIGLFSYNLLPPFTDHSFFSESWSLAVEEFYYLIFPVLAFFFVKNLRSMKGVAYSALTIIVFSIFVRFMIFLKLPSIDSTVWTTYFRIVVITRLDAIAFGSLMSWILYKYPDLVLKFKNHLFVIGLILVIYLDRTRLLNGKFGFGSFSTVFYFTLFPLFVSLMLPFLNHLNLKKSMFTNGITLLSKASFSMYLIHNSFIRKFFEMLNEYSNNRYSLITYALYWLCTIYGSIFVYEKIEKKILSWRDRNYPEVKVSSEYQGVLKCAE